MLIGTQADFEYDVIAELTVENEAAFQVFFALFSRKEAAERINEDEEMFLDRRRMRVAVVGDCIMMAGPTISN